MVPLHSFHVDHSHLVSWLSIFMPLLKVSWQFKLKLHLGDATLGDLPTPARAAVFSFDTTIVITLICVDNKFYAACLGHR
jgi:hypothetical protein